MSKHERRLDKLERRTGQHEPRYVVVIWDDHGNELWPSGKHEAAEVIEWHVGGVDIEEDI